MLNRKKQGKNKRGGDPSVREIVTGGAQYRRKLKWVAELATGAAAAASSTAGDGNQGVTQQPDNTSAWNGLANLWQEYRVRKITMELHPPNLNPAIAANAALVPIRCYMFHDRTGAITTANALAATELQLIDQENSKFAALSPYNPAHVLRHSIKATDLEDLAWLPTQVAANNRFQLVLVIQASGVASAMPYRIDYDVEFRGRANSGLVELSRPLPAPKHVSGCLCATCMSSK